MRRPKVSKVSLQDFVRICIDVCIEGKPGKTEYIVIAHQSRPKMPHVIGYFVTNDFPALGSRVSLSGLYADAPYNIASVFFDGSVSSYDAACMADSVEQFIGGNFSAYCRSYAVNTAKLLPDIPLSCLESIRYLKFPYRDDEGHYAEQSIYTSALPYLHMLTHEYEYEPYAAVDASLMAYFTKVLSEVANNVFPDAIQEDYYYLIDAITRAFVKEFPGDLIDHELLEACVAHCIDHVEKIIACYGEWPEHRLTYVAYYRISSTIVKYVGLKRELTE